MTEDERLLWDLVSDHRGRARPIAVKTLVQVTGLDDRAVRQMVKTLIELFHCPIASTSEPPAGYFIPVTVEEICETLDSLKGRALSILRRMAALRGEALPDLVGQLALELKEHDFSRPIGSKGRAQAKLGMEAPDADPVHVAD